MKKIRHGFLWMAALWLPVACSEQLPENKMTAILADFYLYMELPSDGWQGAPADSISIPLSLFEKHHITQAQFETSMQYYAKRPKEMKALFDRMRDRISEQVEHSKYAVKIHEMAVPDWFGRDRYAIDSLHAAETFSLKQP